MAEHRKVTVAPGHTITVRRSRQQSTRPGFIRVQTSHRAPFDVAERLWNEAPVA